MGLFAASIILFLYICALLSNPCGAYQSPLSTGFKEKVLIEPKSWIYKDRYNIGYEVATHANNGNPIGKEEPVLLLNGFGVGSFHQHRLIPNIFGGDDDDDNKNIPNRIVYGLDYLGQGRSWPLDCDDGNSKNEEGLVYSADTWVDQIIQFIEDVIIPNHAASTTMTSTTDTKVHLVGNSVGGYLTVAIAKKRPDLIQSICLLNATPIWGLNLPGWSGELPPPFIPRKIGRFLFDGIRNLDTIETYLATAYHHRDAFDDTLINQIRACTEGDGGHAAFASILWSPPATFSEEPLNNSFAANLKKVECDALLVFGKEDTWCTPSVGKRMYEILSNRISSNNNKPITRYVELENVAHCPNHEAPQAVGSVVKRWLSNDNKSVDNVSLIKGKQQTFNEPWGSIVSRELDENEAKLSIKDKILSDIVI